MGNLPAIQSAAGLSEKVIVITGSTQGVGFAVARAFAAQGARVVVNGRRPEAVCGAIERLKRDGAQVAGITADVATVQGAELLIAQSAAAFGTIDVLINNAAVAGAYARAWEIGASDLADTIKNNLTGPILCTQEAIRWFLRQEKQGRIINVSSVVTEADYSKFAAYATTKAALEAATRYIACDLPNAEVVVCAIMVPSVQTERKFATDWASTELLPPVDSVVPGFQYAATGPANLLHGRVISIARFNDEPEGEAQLASLAAVRQQMRYPGLFVDGKKVERDPSAMVLLDRAENQYGTSPQALAAIRESLKTHPPVYYPDEHLTKLSRALADEHGLEPTNFAIGPGSWELLHQMVGLVAKPGEEIVSNGPGWFGFNLVCKRLGIAQRLVPFERGEYGNAPSHNLSALRSAVSARTRLVYLISPSNPEGVTLKHRDVIEFLEELPPDLPVVIDEAYAEYANDAEMVNVPTLIRDGRRAVIGLRTFSKFYALAGLRVGYAFAQDWLAELIRRQEHIFTVTHVAEVAAVAALSDVEHRERVFSKSLAAREQMHRALSEQGIWHIRSEAPYIMASTPKRFERISDELARAGILIPRQSFYDSQLIMLPVGTTAQNTKLLKAVWEGR